MKKIVSLISIAAVILIPATLFFTMCLPWNQSAVTAENGELGFRAADLNDRVYALNGNWRIVFGELLPPEDPMEAAELIPVPSTWDEQGYPRLGVATYRLTLRVDDDRMPYMLMMNSVSSAYAMWVNGEPLYSSGTVSPDAANGQAQYSNALVPIHAKDGVLDIVLHVSNHDFSSGGITGSVFFGSADAVQRYFIRTRTMHALALGCILMMALYHLLLYLFRRSEKAYILFALLCFLCFVRFLFETDGLNEYFQIVPDGVLGLRLYMTLLALHSAAIALFALYIFAREFIVKYKVYAVVCFVLLGLAFWFMPINKSYSTMLATVLILVFMVFTVVKAAVSPVLRENPSTRLYFISLFIFLIAGSSKLYTGLYLYMPGLVSNLFMILSQSLLLSQSYAHAFTLVEETNRNLERLVEERTRQLAQTNETLLISQNALKEMISDISHDLKTPLTVLGQYLELLDDGSIDLEAHERSDYIHVAYNKNLNLQRLIRNLFEATRIETGQTVYKMEWQLLSELLFDLEDRHERYLRELGLRFTVDSGADCRVRLDRDKIWSVFDNIIYNAARHTSPGGAISVTARFGGGVCAISISDTGEGIAGEHLPYLFDRFYKVDKSRSGSTGDSGIGLYIAQTVARGMNGSISVQSRVGEGSNFTVTLDAEDTLSEEDSLCTLC